MKNLAQMDQAKVHFLHKVTFLSRRENIFLSQNSSHEQDIFLHRKVNHDLKNVRKIIQIFLGNKNEGYFGAEEGNTHFQGENEYYAFKKNIFMALS